MPFFVRGMRLKIHTDERKHFVVALVAPLGIDRNRIFDEIEMLAETYGYEAKRYRLSRYITEESHPNKHPNNTLQTDDSSTSQDGREPQRTLKYIERLIKQGNDICARAKDPAKLARRAIDDIKGQQSLSAPTIFVLDSLKRTQELEALRAAFGSALLTLGITNAREARTEEIIQEYRCTQTDAETLVDRDHNEMPGKDYGQNTGEVYRAADVFLFGGKAALQQQLKRIFAIWFGDPSETPTRDEHLMYLASASALRSGDLSRQVGAVISNEQGDILASGVNDAPRFGGGQYFAPEHTSPFSARDIDKQLDANKLTRFEMFSDFKDALERSLRKTYCNEQLEVVLGCADEAADKAFSGISEFSRAVHAEMSALLSCARNGVSTMNTVMYCTTFPCHNCAKHLVAAGVKSVVYVEPYPKSRAIRLHSDAIVLGDGHCSSDKMVLRQFYGVSARRYWDFFTLSNGLSRPRKRASGGKLVPIKHKEAKPLFSFSLESEENSA